MYIGCKDDEVMTYDSIENFIKYYGSIRKRTNRVIACIPHDMIEWRPRDGSFSFGDQIRHIAATERYMFIENIHLRPSRYAGCSDDIVAGYENIISYFNTLHDESLELLHQLENRDLHRLCTTPGDTRLTTWKWLRAMVEHEIHHRSQLYVYLGLLDIDVPQLYGLSSEQVIERSI